MSRQARLLSQTGLYHIIFKGIGNQNIFEGSADYEKLKTIISRVKDELPFELYAYCFMTNHVHIFLKENNSGEISKIMAKILSHYATWFNIKYQRSGALFSNRYKSEPVEDERYCLSLIRYIHQNPLKAHLADRMSAYPYSSYNDYVKNRSDFTDVDFLLTMLHDNRKAATDQFIELNAVVDEEEFEPSDSQRKSAASIRRMIMSETDGKDPSLIKSLDKETRDALIKKLVQEKGISKSALERATGISRRTIVRICNGVSQKLPRPQTVRPQTVQQMLPTELL